VRVRAVTEDQIRASFMNCSKSEAKRLRTPDLTEIAWDELDFLGWRDPRAPERAYLVAETASGLTGIELRTSTSVAGSRFARGMCSLCRTVRTRGGTALLVARRAGASGRAGNTVGEYICSDLACSLYVRGRKESAGSLVNEETLSVEAKIDRLRTALDAYLQRVRG
jgi:hypothetical protein